MGGERSINLASRPVGIPPATLARYGAAVMLGLLTAAAVTVVARRVVGALATPLDPVTLFAMGLLVATTAAVIRLGWLLPAVLQPKPRLDQAVMLLTSSTVLAIAVGVCLPETPVAGKFLLCLILIVEESGAWAWHHRRGPNCFLPSRKRGQNYSSPSDPLHPVLSHPRQPSPEINSSAPFSEDVTQRFTRSQAADGSETLSGWLRAAFAAGQRTGSVHVAFCPPFAATPELKVEQLDGPETRVKTAQVLPYGARLDLKLVAVAAEPTDVVLQFSARTPRT
jgi:hypothetical protein